MPSDSPLKNYPTILAVIFLGLSIALGGAASSDAAVRDLFAKSSAAKKPAAVATSRSRSTFATANRSARRTGSPLLAQSDEPLDRLRQRDAERRFRDVVEEEATLPANSSPQVISAPDEVPLDVGQQRRGTEPAPIQPPEGRVAALDVPQPDNEELPEPVTSPAHLKKIGDIQPFYDYHPPTALKSEVCWNLCPRPDGLPCKPDENGLIPECPSEFKLSDAPYEYRPMSDCLYQWQAADQYHNPLYFEDPALERYGHVHHELIQPFVSLARAGVQFVGLPYQMTIDPVTKKMYTLGYYRAGECAPKKYYRIPWNTHAAAVEAGVVTGLIYLFP